MGKSKTTPFFHYSIVFLLVASAASANDHDDDDGEWRVYSEEANGDVYFFDASRIEETADTHRVWTRIQYKTSVMGASSYQSRLEIDCSERTEKTLQRTFFSDRRWETPAMSTDKKEKPKRPIAAGSAAERLLEILCEP